MPLSLAPDQDVLLTMLSRVLASGLELDSLLSAALAAVVEGCGATRGVLALREGDAVRARATLGFKLDGLERGAHPAVREALEHAAREGLSVHLQDASSSRRFGRGPGAGRSVLCVPLRGEGGVLGALYLDHPDESERFAQAERVLAGAFATQIVVPIARAQERSSREGELTRLAAAYRETARELGSEPLMIGRSPAMRTVERLIQRYGATSAPVTIQGESGTGKELVARALHEASSRREAPFIVLNCAAVPENLIESELFGVEKGSFTGADQTRPGLFELAHTGTLFLDEVGDMSLDMQAKLLRVLETGELRSVGGRALIKVDVRIVSATHHDLRELVRAQRFREDLLYRLNVLRVELPPLRDRREDILALTDHFLVEQSGRSAGGVKTLTPEASQALVGHDWPGNVRELRNVIERAWVLEPGTSIDASRLLLEGGPHSPRPGPSASERAPTPDYHKTYEVAGVALNRRQRRVLDHLQSGVASLTNREYCGLVEVSERTGLRDLTHLVEAGLLARIGRRKGARYELRARRS